MTDPMTPNTTLLIFSTIVLTGIGTTLFSYFMKKRGKKRISINSLKGWKDGGQVSKLFIYPVKSCKGCEVESFNCSGLGPIKGNTRDRVFMFVDGDNNFITARRFPRLTQIIPKVSEGYLNLQAPDMDDIHIKIPFNVKGNTNVRVWGETISAVDCKIASDWISKYLSPILDVKEPIKLVYFSGNTTARTVKEREIWPHMYREDGTAFADLAPFLLINSNSVKNLTDRIKSPSVVTYENFRPNILIGGASAFVEDNWSFLKIGEVIFRQTKPCDRCVLTTVDPRKGEKYPDGEPLKTLREYRCATDPKIKASSGSSPFMGINLAVEKEGVINVGDPVQFVTLQ
ncbi:mitochondrial amidoxime reducing component 2-like isoform X2 [Artemia franciscana]|nr:hypothetical protein QYM36_011049 [Artemia franciscana]KAK2712229.1 hypothetical protein QYM36_011049 [Artemia franciscana]